MKKYLIGIVALIGSMPSTFTIHFTSTVGESDSYSYRITATDESGDELGYISYHLKHDGYLQKAYRILYVQVNEAARRQQIGSTLFKKAIQDIQEKGGSTITWTVLSSGENPMAHDALVAFYQKLGGIIEKEEVNPRRTHMYFILPQAKKLSIMVLLLQLRRICYT
jgi:ribosomal protein S18 acetylase RimI-like enzyme